MDVNGAVLNLSCIDLIRTLEEPDFKSRDTIFPASSTIQRVMSVVEEIGKVLCPYKMKQLPDGEAFEFDYDTALNMILTAFKLDDAARQRSVALSLAMDGAKLSNRLNHLTAGIKIRDHAAIDPFTDTPVFAGENSFAQSRDLCFPLHMHLGSETKEKYQVEFEGLFEKFKNLRLTGFRDFKKMDISVNADMSAIWKGLDRGGAANNTKYPCHCCTVTSKELAVPNPMGCSRWCNHLHPESDRCCFHRPMITDTVLKEMQTEQSQLQEALSSQMVHVASSKMHKEAPNNVAVTDVMKNNPFSIFYEPDPDDEELVTEFRDLLESELHLRSSTVDVGSSLEELRTQLKELLVKEYRLTKLTSEISLSERPQTALFLLLQAVPCILHLENRVALKTIECMFNFGLSGAKDNKLYQHLRGVNQRIEAYFVDVQVVVNHSILGSELDAATWVMPYDPKTKSIQPISFENWKVRRIMYQLEDLVDLSIWDETKKPNWDALLPPYRRFMEQLRSKEDWNTEAQMAAFQEDVDTWIQEWVELGENVTNYMHMLAAGHISEYVGHYGNLYEHSQQGWEGLNALLKSVFFRRTSRGGGKKRSRLKPMARWCQRRMLWLTGITKEKATAYLASPAFRDAKTRIDAGLELEEEVYDGLFWEMVL